MPTLVVNHEDPADIRTSMALLAKLMPEETMFLVNTADAEAVQTLITTLLGYLPNATPNPYDEAIFRQDVVKLAAKWPDSSINFIHMWERHGNPNGRTACFERVERYFENNPDIPFGNSLFKGHLLHKAAHDWLTGYAKQGRFWKYVIEQWQLPPTPEGWIPPDMR